MESERRVGGRRSPTTVSGPLAGYASDFHQLLAVQGYARRTISTQMRVTADLSRWLAAGEQTVEALRSAAVIDRFFAERRAQGHGEAVSGKALVPLLRFLRDRHVIGTAVAEAATPAERLLAEYRTYLREERGAAASTIRGFTACAAEFIRVLPADRVEEAVAKLSAADVITFVTGWAGSRSPAYSKSMVSALRSLLRFLHVAGYLPSPLAGSVPAVPGWEVVARPHAVTGQEIAAVLAACDRRSARGRRAYAILMLLTRLGLRAGEVAAIRIDDIDWRQGLLTVRGKGNTLAELPVPVDVGEAMAGYLRHGRPQCPSRQLFVSVRAPFAGLSAESIGSVVKRACSDAGLAGFGPHRLRHAVACQLLRDGAGLTEIGQHLRHRDQRTTARYAAVDVTALAGLARPCPQGAAQ